MVFEGLGPQYGSWQATTGKCSPQLQNERITMQGVLPILQVLAWVILALLGLFIVVHTVIRLVRHFMHFPSPPFVPYLINNPIRRKLWPPGRVIDHMDIHEGMTILEVGPGTGFYTFEAARRAGASGHVYAVDIEPKVIAVLDRRIEQAGVKNITTRIAPAYGIPLPDNSVDRALMVAVLPEIPDKHRALGEIQRVLKKQGLLALAEVLIDPDYPFRKTEIGWCRDTGFELLGDYGSFFFYTLTFRPTDEPLPQELRGRGTQAAASTDIWASFVLATSAQRGGSLTKRWPMHYNLGSQRIDRGAR